MVQKCVHHTEYLKAFLKIFFRGGVTKVVKVYFKKGVKNSGCLIKLLCMNDLTVYVDISE